MELDDFLKCKKVKFVSASNSHMTNGKHYTLLGVTDRSCIVNDDNECEAWVNMSYFEPVLDSAENPLQGVELTPEFEAVKPLTLIEKLKQLSDKYLNQYQYYGDNADLNCSSAVDESINIVKQHSDWISVDERLPNDWSVVLCYGVPFEWDKTSKPNSNILCAVYVAEYDRWSVGYSAFGDTSTQKVTHWQPLPKPPSEVQDD